MPQLPVENRPAHQAPSAWASRQHAPSALPGTNVPQPMPYPWLVPQELTHLPERPHAQPARQALAAVTPQRVLPTPVQQIATPLDLPLIVKFVQMVPSVLRPQHLLSHAVQESSEPQQAPQQALVTLVRLAKCASLNLPLLFHALTDFMLLLELQPAQSVLLERHAAHLASLLQTVQLTLTAQPSL